MTTPTASRETPHAGPSRYVVCWALLALLTGVTFALSSVHLGALALPVALLIAVTKAAIVALFFMHLWDHPGATRLVLLTSVLFVVVLSTLVVADVLTRFPLAVPPH